MSTHPYVSDWLESRLPEWRDTDLADRITLEAHSWMHGIINGKQESADA